ncbi:MAG: hypothetical protein L0Y70_19920 [Gemmataceae bacterium]|nr:hypothetical protein [Gemmataceae bacterium]
MEDFNVLALIKGQEHYIFVYDDGSQDELVDAFRDLAADPHHSLNWFDALVLTKKAREQNAERADAGLELPRSRI